MLKYIAVRLTSSNNSTPVLRARQRPLVRETSSPTSTSRRLTYQQSMRVSRSNGRRVLSAIHRNISSLPLR